MISRLPIHPVLIAMFPILSMYQANRHFVGPDDLTSALVVATAVAAGVWCVLAALTREVRRSAQCATVVVSLFYALGFVPLLLSRALTWLSGFWVAHEVGLPVAPIALVLVAFSGFLLWRVLRQSNPTLTDGTLNIVALVLCLLPLPSLRGIERELARPDRYQPSVLLDTTRHQAANRPDIYYIVLDAYARADVLAELYEFDNRPFLEALEERGFLVAKRSTSNYCQTPLSLASSLNARYLNQGDGSPDGDRNPLRQRISNNAVAATLHEFGYRTIAFDSGFDLTDCRQDVDDFRSPLQRMTEFHALLTEVTPLSWFRESIDLGTLHDLARLRLNYALDSLPSIASDPRPTFSFVHILSPHPPFLHHADGRPYEEPGAFFTLADGDEFERTSSDASYRDGYLEQIRFLNHRLLETIDAIQNESTRQPIIILQSDHGSGLNYALNDLEKTCIRERFGNLLALGWPDGPPALVGYTDDMTPVNLFRVIFGSLIGQPLPSLPDQCFFSTQLQPYQYIDVTQRARGGNPVQSAGSP